MDKNNAIYSTMVRAGRTTYFIDLREAKNGNKYLLITEAKLGGKKKERTMIRVFGEAIEQFRQAVEEALTGSLTSVLVSPRLAVDKDSLETASQMTRRWLAWAREASGGRRVSRAS